MARRRQDRLQGAALARNALSYGDDTDNPLGRAPAWSSIPDPSDPTVPMSQGAAVTQAVSAVDQWMEAQRRKSAAMGLWDDKTGLPTMAGLSGAVGEYGNALLMGTTAPGGRGPGFTSYHGSPHSFDQFDLSKIGTGEGAQAYGHGMYLAEAEGVARGYRDRLTPQNTRSQADIHAAIDAAGVHPEVASIARNSVGDPNLLAFLRATAMDVDPQYAGQFHQLADKVEAAMKPPGHMYEVQVNADPAHFLDWDTPMSRQSDHVVNALKQANGIAPEADLPASIANMTGKQLYEKLTKAVGGQHQASSILQDKYGIPGIRYLDERSRAAGEGTRNSVVFSPEIMEIIRKFGLAGLMAGGGAAATQGAPRQ